MYVHTCVQTRNNHRLNKKIESLRDLPSVILFERYAKNSRKNCSEWKIIILFDHFFINVF